MIARDGESLRERCVCVSLPKPHFTKHWDCWWHQPSSLVVPGRAHVTMICHHCSRTFNILSLFWLAYTTPVVPQVTILLSHTVFFCTCAWGWYPYKLFLRLVLRLHMKRTCFSTFNRHFQLSCLLLRIAFGMSLENVSVLLKTLLSFWSYLSLTVKLQIN